MNTTPAPQSEPRRPSSFPHDLLFLWNTILWATIIGIFFFALPATMQADTTLLSDDFSGGMGNWYRVGSSTKPSITTMNAAPLSGNGMLFAYGKTAAVTYFPSVVLRNPGDYIQASYDCRYTASPSVQTTGPSIALYDSTGTKLTADMTTAADGTLPTSLTDDRGYKAYKSFQTAADFFIFKNGSGFAPLRYASLNPSLNNMGTGGAIALNTSYTISLKIQLAANGTDLIVTSTFSNFTLTYTVTGMDMVSRTFNEIGVNLWGGDNAASGVMDNVLVTTNASLATAAATNPTVFADDFASGMANWRRIGSATKPEITTSNTTPLSGNVMRFGYAKVAAVAYFNQVTLNNPGDYVEASYDMLYTVKQTQSTTGSSLALYDSKGTQLTADMITAADGTLPASLTDDRGYKAYKSFETAGDFILYKNAAGFSPLRFSPLNTTLNSMDTGGVIALNTPYTITLRITLAANGTDLITKSTFGNSTQTTTVTGADVLTKSFDEIGVNLWGGDYAGDAVLDGVIVSTNAIPPGAALLGYTKLLYEEHPVSADISTDRTTAGKKWYRGVYWLTDTQAPPASCFTDENGVLKLTYQGIVNGVETPTPSMSGQSRVLSGGVLSGGALPTLDGSKGFYIEYDVKLSSNDLDHWPAVWLMPVQHNLGVTGDVYTNIYPSDASNYERWMEVDVDEGGFGPGALGSVISWRGVASTGYGGLVCNNASNAANNPLDRTQRHIFGASYDPITSRVTWWLDGVKYFTGDDGVIAGCVPLVAKFQNFYPIIGAQSVNHIKNVSANPPSPLLPSVPYSMYIYAVRAYGPQ